MGEAEDAAATLDVDIGGLGGDVTLADLFPPAWVQSHCDANSICEFLEDSGFEVFDQQSFEDIPDYEWDRHVAAHTEFEDWESMLSAAVERYVLGDRTEDEGDADDPLEARA